MSDHPVFGLKLPQSIGLLLLLWCCSCSPLKKVSESHFDPDSQETYYQTRDKAPLRQGSYTRTGSDGSAWEEGFFRNGRKDSVWIERSYPGSELRGEGRYDQGKRVGLWTYYDGQGLVSQQYNYSTQSWDSLNIPDYLEFEISSDQTNYKRLAPDQSPLMIGGQAEMFRIITLNLKKSFAERPKSGMRMVMAELTIDPNGNIAGTRIVEGVCPPCDKEVLRVLALLPQKWRPAKHEGQSVYSKVRIPIRF